MSISGASTLTIAPTHEVHRVGTPAAREAAPRRRSCWSSLAGPLFVWDMQLTILGHAEREHLSMSAADTDAITILLLAHKYVIVAAERF
jgi:hypothetical protein